MSTNYIIIFNTRNFDSVLTSEIKEIMFDCSLPVCYELANACLTVVLPVCHASGCLINVIYTLQQCDRILLKAEARDIYRNKVVMFYVSAFGVSHKYHMHACNDCKKCL